MLPDITVAVAMAMEGVFPGRYTPSVDNVTPFSNYFLSISSCNLLCFTLLLNSFMLPVLVNTNIYRAVMGAAILHLYCIAICLMPF